MKTFNDFLEITDNWYSKIEWSEDSCPFRNTKALLANFIDILIGKYKSFEKVNGILETLFLNNFSLNAKELIEFIMMDANDFFVIFEIELPHDKVMEIEQ